MLNENINFHKIGSKCIKCNEEYEANIPINCCGNCFVRTKINIIDIEIKQLEDKINARNRKDNSYWYHAKMISLIGLLYVPITVIVGCKYGFVIQCICVAYFITGQHFHRIINFLDRIF